MIKIQRGSDLETVKTAAKAVLEHLFDNHEYCDVKWCKLKENMMANRNENSPEFDAAGPSHERS